MRIDSGSTPPAAAVTVEGGGDTTQLRRYLRAIRRRWPVLVVFAVLGALVGYLSTPVAHSTLVAQDNFYQAIHTLIADGADGSGGDTSPTLNLDQAAFLANKGDVAQRVSDRLGIPVEDVSANVSATALGGVSSIQITAVDAEAAKARDLADTTATELVTYLTDTAAARYQKERDDVIKKLDDIKAQQDDLQHQLSSTSGDKTALQAQYDSAANQYRITYEQFQQLAEQGQTSVGLHTIQAATSQPISQTEYDNIREQIAAGPQLSGSPSTTIAPASGSAPSTPASAPLRTAAGGFLGLILGVIAALILDRYDTRLRQREELEAVTGLPVLAEIPQLSTEQQHNTEVVAFTSRRSRAAEAYRVVRTALIFARTAGDDAAADGESDGPGPEGQVVMVTSPGPDEGKTTTVSNLAAVMAEGGLSVLVINCDFRRPRIQKYLLEEGGDGDDGDQLAAIADTGQVRAVATMVPRVRLVTGIGEGDADANPIEIVAVQKRLIAFARRHYDIVLLDTAPFLTTNDASDLLTDTDAVVLVARCGKTRKEAARRAAELLFRLEAPLLGTVLTDSADAPSAEYYYHYYLDDTETKPRGVRGLRPPSSSSSSGNGSSANGTAPGPPATPSLPRRLS